MRIISQALQYKHQYKYPYKSTRYVSQALYKYRTSVRV